MLEYPSETLKTLKEGPSEHGPTTVAEMVPRPSEGHLRPSESIRPYLARNLPYALPSHFDALPCLFDALPSHHPKSGPDWAGSSQESTSQKGHSRVVRAPFQGSRMALGCGPAVALQTFRSLFGF